MVLSSVCDATSYRCIACHPRGPVQPPPTHTSLTTQQVYDYRYAFFKNAQACYCGGSYGRHRPAECPKLCKATDSTSCEESVSNAVLDTGWMGMLRQSLSSC